MMIIIGDSVWPIIIIVIIQRLMLCYINLLDIKKTASSLFKKSINISTNILY